MRARSAPTGSVSAATVPAGTSRRARAPAREPVAFQLLLYPVTDLSREHPSYEAFADAPFLPAAEMRRLRGLYLADEEDAHDPLASPLLATDLTGLPPAYVALAGLDPLYDEGAAYAARLREAGVDVTLARNEGLLHGFAGIIDASPSARAGLAGVPLAGPALTKSILAWCEHTFVSPQATILHADVDSFFASVEQRDDPSLRGRPVIVGAGVVLAASYEAKAFGVHSAMGGAQARRLCPHAVVVRAAHVGLRRGEQGDV